MKLLLMIPSLSKQWGGTTTSLYNFYKGLQSLGHNCTVLSTLTSDEKNDIDSNILGSRDFIFFETKQTNWRRSKSLRQYLESNGANYDLIWIHAIWTWISYFGSKYAKKHHIPYIVSPHGMIEPDALSRKAFKKQLYWKLIEKNIFDYAAAIHCITEAEEQFSKNLSSTKTFVVPNGVPRAMFMDKEYESLNAICFIGRFHEKKALDLLLRALEKVENLLLYVGGSGEKAYEDYIFSLVDELGISERVIFKGFVNEALKREIFSKSLFLVLPSYTEGLSMVGLEAIMSSTPVLVTQKCNFDEIESYNAGLVIENNDPKLLAENIVKMLNADIKSISKNAYKLAMEKFSIESTASKITNELTGCLAR